MIAIEEEVYTHRSLEAKGTAYHARPWGEAQGSTRRQKESKAWGKRLYCDFCGKGWMNLSEQLNRFKIDWFRALGVVPHCLVVGY